MARISLKILRFQSKMAYIRNKKTNAFQSLQVYLQVTFREVIFQKLGQGW